MSEVVSKTVYVFVNGTTRVQIVSNSLEEATTYFTTLVEGLFFGPWSCSYADMCGKVHTSNVLASTEN